METLPITNNNSKQSNTNRDALSVLPATLSSDLSLFNKRIEFHLARKPFTGFTNGGGGNFHLETLNPTHPNPHHKHADLKPAKAGAGGSEVSENALDAELRFGIITFRRIGAGLENLGNTCFLNSVLQCLTYTEPLAAYLQSGKHQTSCRTAGFCALCAIQKHVSRALQSTGRILAPKEIVSNLRCISRSFRNSRQEDAHEYMVNLLESMHKCCLPSGVPSESSSAYDKSLVHKIFGGRLRSQVKCMQCSFFSDKFDPFLDLSLEINKAESLYKALGHFTAEEQLDGGGRHYHCQKCKQKVKALKQLKIHKAPYVLAIHLKRFGSHLGGQKIDKKIQFGPTLDLKPFVTDPNDGDFKYTLYGVLVHAGWSTHSGHYYCFIRTSSGMWYSLDDNRVVQVSEKRVLEQKAYMLFYHRDRRNVASKKSLDVQKANMTANADGRNKAYSNSNHGLEETVQSGQIQTSANNTPNRTCNSLPMAERSAPNNAPILEVSSGVSPVKDSMKGVCIKSQEGRECLPHQDSLDKGSNVPLKHDTAIIASTDAKLVQVAIQPSRDSILKSVSSKDVTDSITEKASSGMGTANAISAELSSLPNAKDISVQNNVYGGKASQRLKKKLPKCPIMKTRLSSKILGTSLSVRKKKHKRSKKGTSGSTKLLQKRLVDTRLSSKILGTSLSVRKKKHKRSKKGTSGSTKLLQKRLVDGFGIPSDLGPSTSERFKTTPEKGCRVNNMVSNSNGLLVGVTDKEFGERSGQSGAVLAADDRSQETLNTGSEGNQLNGRKDDLMKNDLMSMGTRGLEETIVPRWDEIVESYSSQMTEPSGVKNVSIGYVGDEWDDEYDRGKRRKVRTLKNDYGGPNPFQEVATLNASLKKAKLDQPMNPKFKKPRLDQSSSGNKPYRL